MSHEALKIESMRDGDKCFSQDCRVQNSMLRNWICAREHWAQISTSGLVTDADHADVSKLEGSWAERQACVWRQNY